MAQRQTSRHHHDCWCFYHQLSPPEYKIRFALLQEGSLSPRSSSLTNEQRFPLVLLHLPIQQRTYHIKSIIKG